MGCVLWLPDICGYAVAATRYAQTIVIGCVVYACIASVLSKLVLPKVGGIVFFKVPLKRVHVYPVHPSPFPFWGASYTSLLYIGLIGAYLPGYAGTVIVLIVQQFTDRCIEFVQFQSGIDILSLRPKRAVSEYMSYLLFAKLLERFCFFSGRTCSRCKFSLTTCLRFIVRHIVIYGCLYGLCSRKQWCTVTAFTVYDFITAFRAWAYCNGLQDPTSRSRPFASSCNDASLNVCGGCPYDGCTVTCLGCGCCPRCFERGLLSDASSVTVNGCFGCFVTGSRGHVPRCE